MPTFKQNQPVASPAFLLGNKGHPRILRASALAMASLVSNADDAAADKAEITADKPANETLV